MAPHKRSLEECDRILTGEGGIFQMKEMTIRNQKLRVYVNTPESIRDLWLGSSSVNANKVCIVYENEKYTYAEAHQKILAVTHMLLSYGCKKGDRVVIVGRNLPQWIFTFWAIELLGCVCVAVNAWLPLKSQLHCITFVDPVLVVLDEERSQILKNSVVEMKSTGAKEVLVMCTLNALPGMKSWDREVAKFEGRNLGVPDVKVLPEDLATIFFTSGTTGLPKGVVGTNRQLLSNVLSSMVGGARMVLRTGENLPAPDPNAPQKGMLIGTPLFHATATHSGVCLIVALGGKVAMLRKWDTEKAVELIVRENLTHAGGLPLVGQELLNSLLNGQKNSLEAISYGGGPVSKKLPGDLTKRFPSVAVGQGWGLTEISSAGALVAGQDYLDRPGSTGPAVPVVDLKVVDENYNTLLTGAKGEICIRGASVTNGYWKDEKGTKEVFLPDGWFKSGDIGYLDEDKFLYILDRAKDIIIRGGENIDSSTIEDAIYSDPRILDAAAVPVKDFKFGEVVAVAVTTKPQYHGQVTEAELIALVASQLPKHCIPVLVDIRTETLPRNGVGKTVKADLKIELNKIWKERNSSTRAKL